MVFKRYVKKNGKRYGPYYYESYREDGKVKSRFLGMKNPSENKFTLHFLTAIIFALIIFGILFYGIGDDFFGEIKSFAGNVISDIADNVKFLKNDNGGGNNNPLGQEETPPGQENKENRTSQGQENRNQDGEKGSEDRGGNGGGKSSAQIEKEKKEKDEKIRKEKEAKEKEKKAKSKAKIIKKIQIKKYILNESEGNLSIITSRDRIVIGNPVKWTKNVSLAGKKSVKIELPTQSENISVDNGMISRTGEAVEVSLDGNSKKHLIEYYTPAPEAEEKETSYGKEFIVSGLEELNYTNVLAFTDINESLGLRDDSNIKIYWAEENSYVEFNYADADNDGVIDYLEWNVLHLSEQTFKIILISKAEHLDENRTFVEDVYDFVKARDDNWTEPIPAGDYIRISFERNLTSDRDITIYARSTESGSVQVYEKDEDEMIADFGIIQGDERYKIYLTNLNGSQDVFDLKISGKPVEFDFIVDPLSGTGTLADPYLITNCTDLQEMNDSLGANYSLTNNINCSDTINWNSGKGFEPIGTGIHPFTGSFDGKGYNITEILINRSASTDTSAGLFRYSGSSGCTVDCGIIKNFSLLDINITADHDVGGISGFSYSNITDVYVTGNIVGYANSIGGISGDHFGKIYNSHTDVNIIGEGGWHIGGIAGFNEISAIINNSYASGNITGNFRYYGGLVGWNEGEISSSYSYGNITNTNRWAGGLVGVNAASGGIVDSYATGNVNGDIEIGGLVGEARGSINNSYATGKVSSNGSYVGGFAGTISGIITDSYATGNVNGSANYVGGFVGYSEGSINNSYALGNANGLVYTGGLVGENFGFIINSYSKGYANGSSVVGGLVGANSDGGINNSYATGNVTSKGDYAGGLVGQNYVPIKNSYSSGNVTSRDIAGGLVGYSDATTINNSFSTGSVDIDTGYSYSGGFIGYLFSGVINNGYWVNVSGDDATACDGNAANACDKNSVSTLSYFYTTANSPMSIWDFPPWYSQTNAYPNFTVSEIAATVATIISPTANTYVNSPTIPIEIKINNSGICNYTLDLGTTNTTLTANASATRFTSSRTFSNGAYSLFAYCIDDNGQKNYTTSVNFSVSYTAPVEEQTVGSPPAPEIIPESVCNPSWSCSDWGLCENEISSRSCSDVNDCGTNSGKPSETQICELSCTPNVQCSDWSECNYVDEVEDIITGEISVLGYKEKICSDLSNCIEDYSEKEDCQTLKTSEAKITEETIFGEQTLIVRDAKTGSATTSINLDALKKGRLEVSFVQGEQVYSSECFDGLQNGNETQIDCGGACKRCPSETIWNKYINMWPWLVLIGLIIALAIYTGRELEEDKAIKKISASFES